MKRMELSVNSNEMFQVRKQKNYESVTPYVISL
jgi:hypothetical protein